MKKVVSILCLIMSVGYSSDEMELEAYAKQKYNVDINTQTKEIRDEVAKEYSRIKKISANVYDNIKDSIDYKVANNTAIVNIWLEKTKQSIQQPTQEEIQAMYKILKPRTQEKYVLYNIYVKQEAFAQKLLSQILSVQDKQQRLEKFKSIAMADSMDFVTKTNGGYIGAVDTQKLGQNIIEAIKNKNKGDVVKLEMPKIGWQLIFIDDYLPAREQRLDEVKENISAIIIEEKVNIKINEILNKNNNFLRDNKE